MNSKTKIILIISIKPSDVAIIAWYNEVKGKFLPMLAFAIDYC